MNEHSENQDHVAPYHGASPWLFAVRHQFMDSKTEQLCKLPLKDMKLTLEHSEQSLYAVARWSAGGGVAVRVCYSTGNGHTIENVEQKDNLVTCRVLAPFGQCRVLLEVLDQDKPLIHFTLWVTPDGELTLPFWPSDTYPLAENGDPLAARGIVHAAQRGPATAFLYTSLTEPRSGSLLYIQDLSSLNDYCEKTHTIPETRMGGSWPELGYTPPISDRSPLPPGEELVLSDGYICFTREIPGDGRRSAELFLEMLADIYPHLYRPETSYHHWPERALDTIGDLSHSAQCSSFQYDQHYVNSYVGTSDRRPESLVQLAILLPILEYQDWSGEFWDITGDLKASLPTFYDNEIRSFMRYPELAKGKTESLQADEKKPWEVDSWYLYHPLANLARLARRGDEQAKWLFEHSLPYAVWVAHRFDYTWPVLFDAGTLEIIRLGEQGHIQGEADVPGLYAHVMLDAWEMFGDECYLEEAIRAANSLKKLRFNIGYQFNNTAWSAIALARLWKITGDDLYRGLSLVCVASIIQNTFLWECDYGYAKHYSTFFGITPLREGAYLAMYEEIEVFAAFHEYLDMMGEDISDSLRLLLTEYIRHAQDGKWCCYPSDLPEDIIAEEPENGQINRRLAIPLEDIYQGWTKPGTVGQQVYGAGAAMAISVRNYHRFKDAPFMAYCEYPLHNIQDKSDENCISFEVVGDPDFTCRLRLIPSSGKDIPTVRAVSGLNDQERELKGMQVEDGHLDYTVNGCAEITIDWKK